MAATSRVRVSRVKLPSGSMAKWLRTAAEAPSWSERMAAVWAGGVFIRLTQAAKSSRRRRATRESGAKPAAESAASHSAAL